MTFCLGEEKMKVGGAELDGDGNGTAGTASKQDTENVV